MTSPASAATPPARPEGVRMLPTPSSAGAVPAVLKGHLPALDGVRGVAIAMVLVTHLLGGVEVTNAFERVVVALSLYGGWGVDLFFVLSGFLITGILYDSKGAPSYFRNFYVRRSLRIFPLYYACLAVIFFVLPLVPAARGPELDTLLDQQAWAWLYGINILVAVEGTWTPPYINHFWSLAVEEHFYFVWPLMVWLLSPRALMRASVVLAVAAFGLRAVLLAMGADYLVGYTITPARLDSLCLGAFLAVYARQPGGLDVIRRLLRPVALVAPAVVLLTLAIDHFLPETTLWLRLVRGELFLLLLATLLMHALLSERGSPTQRVFAGATLRFFGKYSYGLYVFHHLYTYAMVHYRTEHVVARWVGHHTLAIFLQAAVALGLSIVTAMVSFHLLEKPFLSLKRHFEAAPPPRAEPALAAPATVAAAVPLEPR